MRHAQRKAADSIQRNCEEEAKQFIVDFFEKHGMTVSKNDIFISWFAFSNHGYICKLNAYSKPNIIFEFSANTETGAKQCDCYERFEYIAIPSDMDPQYFIYKPVRLS